jgi:hypothetical protein
MQIGMSKYFSLRVKTKRKKKKEEEEEEENFLILFVGTNVVLR